MKNLLAIKNSKTLDIISELKVSLKSIFGDKLRQIILFGSYARQEQDEGSDMDIMVLLDIEEKEIQKYRDKILDIIVELTTSYGCVISIIENNYTYFYDWVDYMPFFTSVRNEGINIYG
ncbi:MAG: nucleotidyltransferase domain-containing protein [Candidatus Eremiobacterota bacterium]